MRVLLVEDDYTIASAIENMLRDKDIVCDATEMGEECLSIAKLYDYDIILLDLMLPDIDGMEVLQRLRKARITTPVLILSGVEEVNQKVDGLTYGADDYMTKPFDKSELIARIKAIIRRSKGHADSLIRTGRLTLNQDTQTVSIDSKPIHLTGKEYKILELLCMRKGSSLTKEAFLNHLYGGRNEPELKIIDVFICKLRKKLMEELGSDEIYIDTVWGRGYILRNIPPSNNEENQETKGHPSLKNSGNNDEGKDDKAQENHDTHKNKLHKIAWQ